MLTYEYIYMYYSISRFYQPRDILEILDKTQMIDNICYTEIFKIKYYKNIYILTFE